MQYVVVTCKPYTAWNHHISVIMLFRYDTKKKCQVLVDWLLNFLPSSHPSGAKERQNVCSLRVLRFTCPHWCIQKHTTWKRLKGDNQNMQTDDIKMQRKNKYTELPLAKCIHRKYKINSRSSFFCLQTNNSNGRESCNFWSCVYVSNEQGTTKNYVLVRRPRELVCRNSDMRVNVMMHTKCIRILSTWPTLALPFNVRLFLFFAFVSLVPKWMNKNRAI